MSRQPLDKKFFAKVVLLLSPSVPTLLKVHVLFGLVLAFVYPPGTLCNRIGNGLLVKESFTGLNWIVLRHWIRI